MTENPYAVLRLRPSADGDAIRRTYKRLMRELHPDTNPDPRATELAAKVNAAYEQLNTPERRAAFHRNVGNIIEGWTAKPYRYAWWNPRTEWCMHCGRRMTEMRPYKRADAKFCSNACRQAAYRARKAALKLLDP